jgi:hypothetical protein
MGIAAAVVVGLLFGGADQYVGSLVRLGPWTVSVSQMSAPWLLLPMAFGATQRRPARGALAGLAATAAALLGYFAMGLSPVEGVATSTALADVRGLLSSNVENLVGGALTAPVCGLIGQRARRGRWWPAAVLAAASLALEPVVREAVGRRFAPAYVWELETAAGVAIALAAAVTAAASARRERAG